MFGYIKAYKPELKIKEYEMYKGIYCSLCKQLGKSYGMFSRLILNYDFTFLAICLMATQTEESKFKRSHCTFCMNKKCVCCEIPDASLEYAAAITIMTAYHKVCDNLDDGNIFEKCVYSVLMPYFKQKYKKAEGLFPDIAKTIKEHMKKQKTVESNLTALVDLAADSSAKAMGEIISSRFEASQKQILYRFGYCLGRFVYVSDALDDLEKDFKNKNYNVFLQNTSSADLESIRKNSLSLINITADELAKAYELIDFHRYKSILDNIIYYGLDITIDKVLRKEETQNEKSV